MKYPTVSNLDTQIKVIENAHKRVGKVVAELRELSLRDWKGAEIEMAGLTRSALGEAQEVLVSLSTAKKPLELMRNKCEAKKNVVKKKA